MVYTIVRIILVGVIAGILLRLSFKFKRKIFSIFSGLFVGILFITILFVPFENWFYKSATYEQAYKYTESDAPSAVLEGNSSVMIVPTKRNRFIMISQNKNGYRIPAFTETKMDLHYTKNRENPLESITTYTSKHTNDMYIIYKINDTDNINVQLSDSVQSEFKKIAYTDFEGIEKEFYYTVIDKSLDSYWVSVDGRVVEMIL